MDIRRIALDQIVVSDRIRPVESAWAEALAASFDDSGQKAPIVVRKVGDKFDLVAGAHRLAAATLLGWADILASVETLDDLQARLVEIDENLMRRELGPLDRAMFLAERRRVHLEMHPDTAHGGDRKGRKQREEIKSQSLRLDLLPRRFTDEAAAKIGLSERSIQLSLAIADGLDPELLVALRATPIADNQSALQTLAGMTRGEQRAVIKAFGDAECVTLSDAKKRAGLAEDRDIDPVAEQIAKAKAWFAKWDSRSQQAFLADVQKLRKGRTA